MDEFYSEKGILIHSEDLESEFMIECLQSLLTICPDIKFRSVVCDELINGYRVCFEDSDVRSVLEKRFITAKNRKMLIYPLTTCLIISDCENRNCEREVTNAIQEKFGTVLNLDTEISTNSIIVNIDVPEIKDLNIFKRNGYPRMFVRVPSVYKTFQVSFWCRRCRKLGHTYQECFLRPTQPDTSQKENTGLGSNSNQNSADMHLRSQSFPEKNLCSSVSNFSVPTENFPVNAKKETFTKAGLPGESTFSPNVESCASNVASENAKFSERENSSSCNKSETSKANDIPTKCIFSEESIKKEVASFSESLVSAKLVIKSDEDAWPFPPATSTTEDDDVQIIHTEDYVVSQYRDQEDTTSESDPITKEPSCPPGGEEDLSQSIPVTVNENAPSSRLTQQLSGAFVASPHRQHVGDTKVLSEQLQKCINESCSSGVLDRETLDAFFSHIRKKTNLSQIAENYTENVEGVKEQLKHIMHLHYTGRAACTKEDTAFVKWMSGVIDRFDGKVVSKKRKAAAHTDAGEGTSKKSPKN